MLIESPVRLVSRHRLSRWEQGFEPLPDTIYNLEVYYEKRDYTQEQVRRPQGTVQIDHTLAKMGAKKLRQLFEENEYINTFGSYMFNNSPTLVQDSNNLSLRTGRRVCELSP